MSFLDRIPRRILTTGALAAILLAAGALQLAGANPAASQTLTLTAWQANEDPGLDPNHELWNRTQFVQAPLTAQAGSYAAGGGSIPVVRARALHFNNTLYVRLEWEDSTQDGTALKVEQFADAAAVEFPARSATSVPSVCMGQADMGVNIWQWRSDTLGNPNELYANTLVDMYPSNEDLFYTARAAGNPYANPKQGPVQNLVALAFGTLSPAATQDVQGQGVYENGRWSVVFSRPFTGASEDLASFTAGTNTDIAFAVWNGSQGDRNGRKSVSSFLTLSISGAAVPEPEGSDWLVLALAAGALLVIGGGGVALGLYGLREGKRTA
ncbi:hypothetical protein EDM76_09005 [bacterium]|nr:MAG: hypothetical protein EDM76_09005 [bacterium]MCL4231068.1 hypothetical protein [Dehalococcoidia bacterium]